MKTVNIIIFILCIGFGSLMAQNPEEKIRELGIVLPEVGQPIANYVQYVRSGNLIFLAGHGPVVLNNETTGKVGKDLTIDQGYQAARSTGISLLATLKSALGDLNNVQRIVKVTGMVNCLPDFYDQPKVINGCSDLITEIFGEKGKHARAAVGMVSLPGNMAVEIEMIIEIAEGP